MTTPNSLSEDDRRRVDMLSAGFVWFGVSEIGGNGCHAENFGRPEALLAKGADGHCVMALGEADAF
jgi:hypothetical protein